MEKQTKPTTKQPLPPIANWVMAGVAFGISYVAVSRAIDTGSLIEYAVALVLLGLGIRHLVHGVKAGRAS